MGRNVNIKRIVERMTVEEKLGQLTQFSSMFFKKDRGDITGPMNDMGVDGNALDYAGSVLGTACAADTLTIQKKHLENDRHKIPMLFCRDVIHGFRTIYPAPIGLSCSFDPKLASECARMTAEEASAGGVHLTFAPASDYVRDARWGRVMENYGEDPLLSGSIAASQIKAYHGDDLKKSGTIATCAKHFACYGAGEAGRDYNTVEISEHVMREFYFRTHKACVDAGVKMIMPAFNDLSGVPCTANKWLMNRILRHEWGFKGVVVSDWGAIGELVIHGVAKDMKEAAKLAFECGVDIEMMSGSYYRYLKELIEEGKFTQKQLDNAVFKILKLKKELGLFDDPYHGASEEKEKELFLCDKHREIVRRAAEESAVLLKNENVLPFDENKIKKIALIGPFANYNGLIGSWACSGKKEECATIEEAVKAYLKNAEVTVENGCGMTNDDLDTSGFDSAIKAAKKADAVILCLGEPENYTGEGNCRTDLTLPGVQTLLARKVAKANPNTAVLLFNGRPLVLTELSEFAPAILEMWYPGTEGANAAVNLVFGKANPCGKLSMSFPKSVGQCPIYYNYYRTGRPKSASRDAVRENFKSSYLDCGNLPLYFFGEGLSYTQFEYQNLKLDADVITKNSKLIATVKLKNTGTRAGKETVQLYLRDVVSSAVRPVQELFAFEKVHLNPGETKLVRFEITEEKLRFWNADNKYVSEPGEFEISVGYANHMKFTRKFQLK